MTRLALVRNEKFRNHLTPESHPESPRRLLAIDRALHSKDFIGKLCQVEPREATDEDLARVHQPRYIDALESAADKARQGEMLIRLDPDTWMSPQSLEAAKLAAGAGLVAVDTVFGRQATSSFVAVRPPGHHALAGKAMGFCLFNNIAIAARYAQQIGYKRVLILDWDVHHGNGTQAMFFDDPTVLFLSTHQYPFWPPNSGWYTEHGTADGTGFNLNIPLPAGTGDRGYLKAWDEIIKPVSNEYDPDIILVSAGYDAHQLDPLAQQQISTFGFQLLSARLFEQTKAKHIPVICFLEGGYNTGALAESVAGTIDVLNAGRSSADLAGLVEADKAAAVDSLLTTDALPDIVDEWLREVKIHFCAFWGSLA